MPCLLQTAATAAPTTTSTSTTTTTSPTSGSTSLLRPPRHALAGHYGALACAVPMPAVAPVCGVETAAAFLQAPQCACFRLVI